MVPSIARSQYDPDGIAHDAASDSSISSITPLTTSTTILSTTIVVPAIEDNDSKNVNGTISKKPIKKGIFYRIIFLYELFFFNRNYYWHYCWYSCSYYCNTCWYWYISFY